ncbi:MAG: hypothetical protein Q8O56_12820 [Solirubrobacteraceae bacterium]|nr:hypothetical protein [Solirubrobacteraceae bacterium]
MGPTGPPGASPPLESRIAFTFSNSWRVFGGGTGTPPWGHAGYYKHNGIVYLEGLLDRAGGNWVTGVILTLPVGYRPPSDRLFHVGTNPANAATRVDMQTNGQLFLQVGGASNPVGYLALSGIFFRAA